MNIFHLFKKKREYGDYRLSENAAKYEEIASAWCRRLGAEHQIP